MKTYLTILGVFTLVILFWIGLAILPPEITFERTTFIEHGFLSQLNIQDIKREKDILEAWRREIEAATFFNESHRDPFKRIVK